MSLIVRPDKNIVKYITSLRKFSHKPIRELKRNIEDETPVLKFSYYDTEELIKLKNVVVNLNELGAEVRILEEEDRQISLELLSNLIETYREIAREREDLDDRILEDTE
ncbi:hypothetical protein [Bacillus sp. 491mf]|uniref:hypothetical protein n=1 Tax=Bacillus sp. 491mf TaxID=1761755 RepID=UPI000B86FCF1|nr:hypothetical protein [Bacillus sp. 491mf]